MTDLDEQIALYEAYCPCDACDRLRKSEARKRLTLGARIRFYVEKLREAMR